MKKVMVLGAGRGQIPVMELCHQYGCHVIAVSPKGNYPGIAVADTLCEANVKDAAAVLQLAREHQIDAIVTDQLDAAVLTAAYVAEKMGIPGISYDVALKFTNKYRMRQEAKKAGVSIPEAISAASMEEVVQELEKHPDISFPMMLKPVDSAASRGICKVYSLEDIAQNIEYAKQYSASGRVIIEEFVTGHEYVVEAYTHDHQVTNLVVGHRDYFQVPDTFIPNATVFRDADSAVTPLEDRLKEINRRIVESFGLPFGITHAEYLYDEARDEIFLVEIAARGGGVFISSALIPAGCGVNANDLLVRDVLGMEVDPEALKLRKGASAYFCYLLPPGQVTVLENTEQVDQVPGVIRGFFDNIELGMVSKSITDKTSRKGPILVQGKDKEACYRVIEQVKQLIDIQVQDENGAHPVIWHDMNPEND